MSTQMNSSAPDYSMAKATDLAAVVELLSQNGLPHEDISPHLTNMVVAKINGRLVGTAAVELHGNAALLRSVCVAKDHRVLGVASQLCELVCAHARNMGVTTLYLLTTTAEGFFGARGFRPSDRNLVPPAIRQTREFLSLCPASAACLKRQLGDDALYLPSSILPLRDDVPGARMWGASLKSTMLTYFEVEPNTRFELHSHEGEQMTTVIEGELFFAIDQRVIRVGPGDVMAIPPGVAHSVFTREYACRAFDAWSPPPRRYAATHGATSETSGQ